MDIALWICVALALLLAWGARKQAAAVSERVDEARRKGSTGEADLGELKTRVEVLSKLLEHMAGGKSIDPLMVREGRLYRNISAPAFQQLFQGGQKPYVIDVRSPQEWATGHIPGAVHVPVDALDKSLHQIKRDGTPMYLLCAGGGRSSTAAGFLAQRGYLNVFNVEGGMNAWRGEVVRD